jgi:hypothetical protein
MAGGANPDGASVDRDVRRSVEGDADDERLTGYATELADAVDRALPGWVERAVAFIATAWFGVLPDDVAVAARSAGLRAAEETGPAVRAALLIDVDDRGPNPLAVLRGAVRFPTGVLRDAGVPPVERDPFVEARFPDDDYDLIPTSFGDLDPSLHDVGLAWGAARAFVHRSRHRDRAATGDTPT